MSIVPSRNNPTRPKEKQAVMPSNHNAVKPSRRRKKDDKKLYTKLAVVPPGARLHLWMFKEWVQEYPRKIASYRCAVCDYTDKAPWPNTPDAHEPYCPAPKGMID